MGQQLFQNGQDISSTAPFFFPEKNASAFFLAKKIPTEFSLVKKEKAPGNPKRKQWDLTIPQIPMCRTNLVSPTHLIPCVDLSSRQSAFIFPAKSSGVPSFITLLPNSSARFLVSLNANILCSLISCIQNLDGLVGSLGRFREPSR